MSWMKRPRAPPGNSQDPGQNIFNPTQPPMPGSGPQQQQWATHQQHSIPQQHNPVGNYPQQPPAQQQYWQQPPQQQSAYSNNTNSNQQHNFATQPQQQNYPNNQYQYNQQYASQQQPGFHQNYQQQPVANVPPNNAQQHNFQQQSWEGTAQETPSGDSWDWGWQDDAQQQNVQPPTNANIIANSFSNAGDSWNWSLDEQTPQNEEQRKESTPQSRESSHDTVIHRNVNAHSHSNSPRPQNPTSVPETQLFKQNDSRNTPVPNSDNNNKNVGVSFDNVAPPIPHLPMSEPNIKTLSDDGALLEHNNSMPNMAVAHRRYLNDTLTPQWSTESQPSQDSSDGLLTESTTNRSEDPSTKSSPSFSQDNTNFNYPHNVDNIPDKHWNSGSFKAANPPVDGANQELIDGVRGMNLNRSSASPSHNVVRPSSVDNTLADLNLPNVPVLPPPSNKPVQLPPSIPSFPPSSSSSTNPFKRAGQISHKTANKIVTQQITTDQVSDQHQPFTQQEHLNVRQPSPALQSVPLSSPRIVQQQNYSTANLETTPDNSERPDIPAPVNFRPMQYPIVQNPVVENFEVAPSNDRNEYLQTGHLSEVSFDNTNFTDDSLTMRSASQEPFPPPGLRRMVLGQPESEFNQSSNDEPPPGLSRMVPGQLNDLNVYAQPSDDYLDRQVDGQTTESESLNSSYMNRTPNVYRVGDGQPTDDETNYTANPRSSADRRPVGLDRMVPGESSNFQGFQNQNFSNDRVVTGFNQTVAPERRDQNMDGSDYSELDTTQQVRSIVGVETVEDNRNVGQDNVIMTHSSTNEELNQREINMEGENLQDLSVISSTDFSLVRDQNMDGADIQDEATNRPIDVADSGSERQAQLQQPKKEPSKNEGDRKYHDDTTGDESERDRYNRKSKKEKDRMKTSREREGRYSGDKRDDRKERDRRGGERERDDDRSYRRSARDARYETEDTDYYSDRDRRRYREGSYTSSSKPPRPERRGDDDTRRSYDRSLRESDRDNRRHRDGTRYGSKTGEKDDNSYESERDGYARKKGDKERGYDDREGGRRYDRRDGGYNSLRKSKARDERKRDSRYPPRPDSRDPDPTEEDDPNVETGDSMSLDRRGRTRHSLERDSRHKRDRRDRDRERDRGYYDSRYAAYGMDPYTQQVYQHQQQTYQYYEKLRLTNPQAYMEIYSKYVAGQHRPYGDAYSGVTSYDPSSSSRLADERGSVHSGQSSTNGEALKDRSLLDSSLGGGSNNYFYPIRNSAYRYSASMGHRRTGSESIRTDISDSRDYNTDSMNFGLENSTVKSERMTPVKFATAHIKGVISSTNLVTVTPSYPVDGQPAIVEILDLNKILANDAVRCELTAYPGPLVKGTTHKKTVIEYCEMKIREALDRHSGGYTDRSGGYYGKPHHPSGFTNSGNSNSVSERQTISSISHLPSNTDIASYVLMWELLILLLRQNGMVVGTDIAELLVKNKRQFEWRSGNSAPPTGVRNLSRRGSNSSVTSRSAEMPIEEVMPGEDNTGNLEGDDSSNDAGSTTAKNRTSSQQQLANKSGTNVTAVTSGTNSVNVRRASSHANILESPAQEKYVTDKFREYLLFGSEKEALEWAMSHGLWGHALFLASKLDKRTYANVMMRFANGLAANDPLQTLYQLMSGRQPASVTCVLDEKWGDWRPHLAMILSNTTQRPELDRKSITTLGDTLLSRGDVYAAHFCYLMSREEPSSSPGSRLQLLGLPLAPAAHNSSGGGPSSLSSSPYKSPSHNIIMTEIYEYACSLNQTQRAMGHFQFYKFLLATRLVDCGLYERALLYLETIANAVAQEPHQYQGPFLQRVLDLAERLKYFDPEENVGDLSMEDQDPGLYPSVDGMQSAGTTNRSSGDKIWLTTLRDTVAQIASDPSSHVPYSAATQFNHQQHQTFQQQHNYYRQPSNNAIDGEWSSPAPNQHSIQTQQHGSSSSNNYEQLQMQQQQEMYERQQQQQNSQYDQQHNSEIANDNTSNYHPQMYDPNSLPQGQNSYLSPMSFNQQDSRDESSLERDASDYTTPPQVPSDGGQSSYWNQDQQQYGYHENHNTLDALDQPRPQISMPNAVVRSSQYDESDQEQRDDKQASQRKPDQQNQKSSKEKKDVSASAKTQASTGWFGGIFNKLSLKPKNQMILPDDKNPSIVWDSEKKKWVNLDSDEQEKESQLAPPPKMSDIVRPSPNINNNIPPPMASVTPEAPLSSGAPSTSTPVPPANMPNIFKLQKSRHIKKAYVDVFNPSGAPMKPLAPASEVLGDPMMMTSQSQGPPTSYFVPGPEQGIVNPSFYNPSDY